MKDTSFNDNQDLKQLAFIYFYCPKTGRLLVEHRLCDHHYGIVGGLVNGNETCPRSAALREAKEETGYDQGDPSDLVHLCGYFCQANGEDRYCNIYIMIVDEEFEPKITGQDLPPLTAGLSIKALYNQLHYHSQDQITLKESHSLQWVKPLEWPEPMQPKIPQSLGLLIQFIEEYEFRQSKISDIYPATQSRQRSAIPA